jgi:ectoine hydroxylase-related dioxygenase (phytanoyl-CoA dioxygenase family)
MNFKSYKEIENISLEKDGFQVFDSNDELNNVINSFSLNLEEIAKDCNYKDVFRTKLGDIKQIQNLDFKNLNPLLAKLVGAKNYKVLNNQYFCKPPNYKMTSAHQDNAYFESNDNVVTFWIPLQDVDVLNSCMFYVPRSHKEGIIKHDPIGTNVRTRTGKTGYSLYSSHYKNKEFYKVEMKKGQILIHDKNTMHFSSPNISDDYRIALTCIMHILD